MPHPAGHQDAPRARLLIALAFTVIFVLEVLFLFRCSSPPSSPTPPPSTTTSIAPSPPPAPPPVPPGPPTETTECNIVGVTRAGIRHESDGVSLRLFVPMKPLKGEGYVNVWTPEVNERLLGRCEPNDWCDVTLPAFGKWRIRLAAETEHEGKVYQCDRHWFEVEAKPPPRTTTTVPRCDVDSFCEVYVTTMGAYWATAHITACDYTGVVTLTGTKVNDPRWIKTTTQEYDQDCECTDGEELLKIDTRWSAHFTAQCVP